MSLFRPPDFTSQMRRQIEDYLIRKSLEWYGDRDRVPIEIAVDMCMELNQYLLAQMDQRMRDEYERMATERVDPRQVYRRPVSWNL